MKRAVETILLFVAVAGFASAGTIPFGAIGLYPITLPDYHEYDGIKFSYDAGNITPVNVGGVDILPSFCTFDAGNGGIQAVPGCVGAQIDTSGIYGTTDGTLIIDFPYLINGLFFPFQMADWAVLTDPAINPTFNVAALFYQGGNLTDVATADAVSLDGGFTASGVFQYAGTSFDQVQLNFSPSDPLIQNLTDPNTGTTTTTVAYGQSTFQISDMEYAPEPGSAFLLGGSLLLLASAALRRKRAGHARPLHR